MVAELRHAAEEGRGLGLDRDAARLLLLLTREGVEYAELLAQWGRPLDQPHGLRLLFARLAFMGLAELRGCPGLYCLKAGDQLAAALEAARLLVEGPTLTLQQARVLLLVSLEGETVADIADCLEERGHEVNTGALRRALKALAAAGLLEVSERASGGRGRASTVYRLATGAAVEEALDLAYQMTSGPSAGAVSPS